MEEEHRNPNPPSQWTPDPDGEFSDRRDESDDYADAGTPRRGEVRPADRHE